eukprot:gene40611-49514_t
MINNTPENSIACYDFLKAEGPERGLYISPTKNILWMPFGLSPTLERLASERGCQIATGNGVRLLGGALSADPAFHAHVVMERVHKCVSNVHSMMRLKDPQLCLLLLRSCLGMPQLTYSFRVALPSTLIHTSPTRVADITAVPTPVTLTGFAAGTISFSRSALQRMLVLEQLSSTADSSQQQTAVNSESSSSSSSSLAKQ